MAEVLSQSQIDALLNAARSGEMELTTNEQSSEKKYRKYDFYSPRKFTKDRLKMISGVFENYTRIINSRINGLLHTTCEIAVESVEEQRYYEFSNALSDGDVLTLMGVEIEGETPSGEESPALVHFSTGLMLNMMDRLMGGEGESDDATPAGYTFTPMELKLYEDIVKDLINILGGSWENYIDLNFIYRRIEANPTLVQLIGLDETVVIVSISIKFPNTSGRMSICLPGMMLTNIFTKIASLNQAGRGSGDNNSDEIMDILRDSDLEITAELGRTELALRDIYYLNVGDVVDLGRPTDTPICLYIGGQPWFSGKLGTQGNNMAVKIGETFHIQSREEK